MKTVAVRVNDDELNDLREAFVQYLDKVDSYKQRGSGLDLLALWFKLEAAADDVGSFIHYSEDLPKWARAKMQEALRTAGQVADLKTKVETLEARAKARGITAAAQPPTVTKPRKKPARKSTPKPAPVTTTTEAGAVS